jgi:threonine-phosphate decarboxylase
VTHETPVHGGNVWESADDSAVKRGELIDFSSNINPIGPSKKVLDAIRGGLWRLSFYPQTNADKLRAVIAERHKGLTLDNVIITNGSSELIHLFATVFIENGSSAILPIPTFSEYESAVLKAGGRVKYVRPKGDLGIDVEAVLNRITDDCTVIICNPNNPTGRLTDPQDLREIIHAAAEHGAPLLLDEAFMDFVRDQDDYSLAEEVSEYGNLLILRSLTKFYGLAGLRIGYGLASGEIIRILHNAKIPWNVNCLAQIAAEAALTDRGYAEKVRRLISMERRFMMRELRKNRALRVYDSAANFILLDTRGAGLTGREIAEEGLAEGLMIRDCGSFKGLDDYYIRIAIKTRSQNLALLRFLNSLVGKSEV